jgi:hypothetical protein
LPSYTHVDPQELLCGIYDLHNAAAVQAAERAVEAGGEVNIEPYDNGDTDSSCSSSSSSESDSDNEAEPSVRAQGMETCCASMVDIHADAQSPAGAGDGGEVGGGHRGDSKQDPGRTNMDVDADPQQQQQQPHGKQQARRRQKPFIQEL